jgi:hypothetical protein
MSGADAVMVIVGAAVSGVAGAIAAEVAKNWLAGIRPRTLRWILIVGLATGGGLVTLYWLVASGREDRTGSPWGNTAGDEDVRGAVWADRGVRIVGLVPDPIGDDEQLEELTIRNSSGVSVPLAGWKVRDLSNGAWSLDELRSISPGETKRVQRSGRKMWLDNDGDTIDLVDEQGRIVHQVTYGAVREGEAVSFDG